MQIEKLMVDSSPHAHPLAYPGFAQRALSACIRAYQIVLSPMFGAQCRYYPSCSNYALEAIHHHGACKGLLLSAGRIARCNPLCAGGHDPVPHRI